MKTFVKCLITAVVAVAVTGTAVRIYDTILPPASGLTSGIRTDSMAGAKFDRINDLIKNEYLYDNYDVNKMEDAALKGYVAALDEPYTSYFSADEFKSYTSNIEDSYVGVGIVVSVDEAADKIIIIAPTEDSPAREAGLLPGDYILAVNGKSYSGDELDACVSSIKAGKAGTTVSLSIERNGTVAEYVVERKEISAHSVKGEMLDGEIGYIRISEFNTHGDASKDTTYTEFKAKAKELTAQGMKKLIIDVRDNPGGVLPVACNVADYLLGDCLITYTETKSGSRKDYRSKGSELGIPMAVLINGNSASAAEVLTGALKDNNKAVVIGETSFGKGIVQEVMSFPDGSGISLTTAKYYTPSGVCIHEIGIEPDHKITLPEEFAGSYVSMIPHEKDTQLNKAMELLK